MNASTDGVPKLDPLIADDIDAVIAIDRKLTGIARRGFFEKRLAAALAEPKNFIYVACRANGQLVGFALARLAVGEFGRNQSAVAIDSMGVDPASQGHGIGKQLVDRVTQLMQQKDVSELATQVPWGNGQLLRFFSGAGFSIGPRVVLERGTSEPIPSLDGDDDDLDDPSSDGELDFSSPDGDDFTALSHDRVPVRSMAPSDLDAIVRIDSKLIGRQRHAYVENRLTEAMNESGVRVSLVAEIDGLPAGYIMARVDYGEYGRAVPVAVLDTLGVDPTQRQHGVGHALMSQLVANLSILRVDTIRTHVAWNATDLITYFDHIGFEPAQQLLLRRVVG